MSTIKECQNLLVKIMFMIAKKDWPDLIKFLQELDLENMESDLIVTAARSIYTARSKLDPDYEIFVRRAIKELDSRELNGAQILKGLL